MSGETALIVTLLASMAMNVTLIVAGGAFFSRLLKNQEAARERERRDLAEIMRGVPLERDVEIVNPEMPETEEPDHDDLVAAFNRAEQIG